MKQLLLLFLVLLIGFSVVVAQSVPSCAEISIESDQRTDPGRSVVFLVRTNIRSESLQYKWRLTAGTITSDENTSSIVVDTAGLGGQKIEASVDVSGSGWSCSLKNSVQIAPPPMVCGLAFDQYGDIDFEDEKARLDNFAIQLLNQPSARGALIAFAGNPTYKGEAAFRLRRAKKYLVAVRGIDPGRLLMTDAGYRSDVSIYLWVVPKGASSPVVESDVPVTEIRFTKKPPKTHSSSK